MNRIIGYLVVSLALVLGGIWVAAQVDLTAFQAGDVIRAEEVNGNFDALADAITSGIGTLNGLAGDVAIVGGSNVTVTSENGTITIDSAGETGTGSGLERVATGDGLTGEGTSDAPLAVAEPYRLPQACSSGQVAEWDGVAWICAADDIGEGGGGGDITSVTAGTGLLGGGESGGVTVTLDTPFTDRRYATRDALGNAGSSSVHWENLTDVPSGLADGDDDTTYTAGSGLASSDTTFRVAFAGSGSANTVARSDHDHLGRTWTGTNQPLVITGEYTASSFDASEPEGAPLVLTNTSTDTSGYRAALRVTESTRDGILLGAVASSGFLVDSAGFNGYSVASAGNDGVYVNAAGENGFQVGSAGSDGFFVNSAGAAGVRVGSVVEDGVYVDSADGNGFNVASAGFSGFYVGSAAENGVSVISSEGSGLYVRAAGSNGVSVDAAETFGGYLSGDRAGVVANAGVDANPDLILEASGNSNDASQGILTSDPFYADSDLVFKSNDFVQIELDDDASGQDADFYIRDSADTIIFNVDDGGNATLAGTLTENSDVHAKQSLALVDACEVLAGVVATPVYRWAYRDDPGVTHIGPTAQDFHAAFEVGANDTGISTIDRDGVALASIQALHALLEQKDARLAEQRARLEAQAVRIEAQAAQLESLAARVASLEQRE